MNKYTLIFIFSKNRVLLLNRFNAPAKGTWCGVGGHIEEGETPLDCALRELEEETGEKLKSLIPDGALIARNDEREVESVNYLFHASVSEKVPTRILGEGITMMVPVAWALAEDNEGVNDFTRKAIKRALNKED